MENLVKIIIYIHAFFGGIGLVAGTAVMIIKKGNSTITLNTIKVGSF